MPDGTGGRHHSRKNARIKVELRTRMRAVRRGIPIASRRAAARLAAVHALRIIGARRTVAVYLSIGDELGTGPLILALLRRRHRLCVPRINGQSMAFVTIGPGTPLRLNRYGIAQPVGGSRVRRVDAVLLPLLAFDRSGKRLGQGGGHYDRALASSRPYRRPLRIGYGFSMQEVPRVPAAAHDVDLHVIVTEAGVQWPTG